MVKVKDIISSLEILAPLPLQEDYDNAGLMVGHPEQDARGCLVCLDVTESVMAEAKQKNIDLIISHHPVIFGKLLRITGKTAVERILTSAIREGISIYSIHTNLDNVQYGVSNMLAKKIGLMNPRVLRKGRGLLRKLVTFCPGSHADRVREAIFNAGAGQIGHYDRCSFNAEGFGTFRGDESANPFVGQAGQVHTEPEVRIETIYPFYNEKAIIQAMLETHPYEEVAYDIYKLENEFEKVGMGMIGELEPELSEQEFMEMLKLKLDLKCIRHSSLRGRPVKKVAVCGGSGSFLIPDAIRAKADFFVTADLKYHQFQLDSDEIVLADIGHFESEQFTCELLAEYLKEKFPKFAVLISDTPVNPVNYF